MIKLWWWLLYTWNNSTGRFDDRPEVKDKGWANYRKVYLDGLR